MRMRLDCLASWSKFYLRSSFFCISSLDDKTLVNITWAVPVEFIYVFKHNKLKRSLKYHIELNVTFLSKKNKYDLFVKFT